MRYFSNRSDEVCSWVSERLAGYLPDEFKPCSTLAFVKDKQVVAGVIFNNFRPSCRDIQLTIAADTPSWIGKDSLRVIFRYVFIQLGCVRLTVSITKKNKRARRLAEGLGFKYEGNLRKGFDGVEDCIIYGMLHNECRWIGEKHGQKHSKST